MLSVGAIHFEDRFCASRKDGMRGGDISDILGSFQSGGALSGQRAITIERSLMSGCSQGHELVKNMWKKLWLKVPGLTRSRSRNTGDKRCD